jgi:4-hydroxy-3-methylbut-2-enyl diphosphate reductase
VPEVNPQQSTGCQAEPQPIRGFPSTTRHVDAASPPDTQSGRGYAAPGACTLNDDSSIEPCNCGKAACRHQIPVAASPLMEELIWMRVLLAQPRGFCAGVVRAIEIVERSLKKFGAPVYVRHEIVHNRHVVEKLERMGAVFVESLDEIPDGATTIFSAHGVAQSIIDEAKARGLPVLDATCPLVSKVHLQGKRYVARGRALILIGHAGHPEVEGTMGQVDAPVHLVSTVEDVARLDVPPDAPVAYVTQTTLSVDDTRGVIAALRARFSDLEGPDVADICYATQHRQSAVRELCELVDLLLVVGSRNSSNSNRLREIAVEKGLPSYLIADGGELDPAWLAGVKTIGLTAGASAPEELVLDVIEALRRHGDVAVEQMTGVHEDIEFRLPNELRATSPAE